MKKPFLLAPALILLINSTCFSDEKKFLEFLSDGVDKLSTNGQNFIQNKIEGLQLGLIILSQKSKYTDEHYQDVAVIMNYEGFYNTDWDLERFLGDNMDIEFIPTNASININGKRLKILTNLATLDYFSDNGDFVLTLSTLSLTHKRNDQTSIKQSTRLSYFEIEGAKVYTLDEDNLSDLEFELVGSLGIGGLNHTKAISQNSTEISSKDMTYAKVGVESAISLPLTADLPGASFFGAGTDIRLSAGTYFQKGKDNDYRGTYIGLDVNIGDSKSALSWNPYLKWNFDQVMYKGPYKSKIKDSVTELGIRLNW